MAQIITVLGFGGLWITVVVAMLAAGIHMIRESSELYAGSADFGFGVTLILIVVFSHVVILGLIASGGIEGVNTDSENKYFEFAPRESCNALNALRQGIAKGDKAQVLQMATGSGKTTIASHMMAGAKARESRWCDMAEAEVWGASEAEYKRRCL